MTNNLLPTIYSEKVIKTLLEFFGCQDSDSAFDKICTQWNQSHRYYHNVSHLAELLLKIQALALKSEISVAEQQVLVMTAIFHDIVYDPRKSDNEEQSVAMFEKLCLFDKQSTNAREVVQIILDTKTHKSGSKLSRIFCDMDMSVLFTKGINELIRYEDQVLKEYQFVDYNIYRQKRIEFLESVMQSNHLPLGNLQWYDNLRWLVNYIRNRKIKIGVYPGSFDPFHKGHLNVLRKAEKLFDKIIIAKGINPDKASTGVSGHIEGVSPRDYFLSIEKNRLQQVLPFHQVESFDGLLTDYLKSKETVFTDVTLIRGLRNGKDLDYEVNQLRFLEEMSKDVKVVYIPCDKQYEHISSSAIRSLNKIDASVGGQYLVDEYNYAHTTS